MLKHKKTNKVNKKLKTKTMETQNTQQKPIAQVIGQDGNVFNLVGICSKALKKAGQKDKADEMQKRVFASGSYDEALSIMGEYCELT